jgi:hypothetical protein
MVFYSNLHREIRSLAIFSLPLLGKYAEYCAVFAADHFLSSSQSVEWTALKKPTPQTKLVFSPTVREQGVFLFPLWENKDSERGRGKYSSLPMFAALTAMTTFCDTGFFKVIHSTSQSLFTYKTDMSNISLILYHWLLTEIRFCPLRERFQSVVLQKIYEER